MMPRFYQKNTIFLVGVFICALVIILPHNLFAINSTQIDTMILDLFPTKDTIPAGDSIEFRVILVGTDSLGNPFRDSTALCGNVTWQLTKSLQSQSYLRRGTGPSSANTFKAITGYEWDTITVFYIDTATGITLNNSKAVYITAGEAARIVIQSDSLIRLSDPFFISRSGEITLDPPVFRDTIYAVLRDQFGNWVSYATASIWQSKDTNIAKVFPGGRVATIGEGITERVSSIDTTWGYASQFIHRSQFNDSILVKDSIKIILTNITYSKIQIFVISSEGIIPIDTLRMAEYEDTILCARGLRSDNSGIWDDIGVFWSQQGLRSLAPPTFSGSWRISFPIPDTGIISITLGSGSEQLHDTITAFFCGNLPGVIFSQPCASNPVINFTLHQSIVRYTLNKQSSVLIQMFDIRGRHVVTLVNAYQAPGYYSVSFGNRMLPAGQYIFRFKAGGNIFRKKMAIV